jgi:DNA-binding transcriptional ArsR family regulator
MDNDPAPDHAPPGTVQLDSTSLHALAHPLRIRLLGALRWEGPATATALAHRLGTNSGATSYHLRQLEQAGLVAEAEDLGTRRERWWRSAHQTTRFEPEQFQDSPDDRAAAEWLLRHHSRKRAEWVDEWVEVRDHWPAEWREAADLSDYRVRLTPDRLQELNDEIHALLRRYQQADEPDTPGAEQVLLLWSSFPSPRPPL